MPLVTPDDATKTTLHGIAKEYMLPETIVLHGSILELYEASIRATAINIGASITRHGIYVMGDIHTNTIEGFWSLIKRGIGGVYHSVSKKYLQTYLGRVQL